MPSRGYYLTEADRKAIADLIRLERSRPRPLGRGGPSIEDEEFPTPDVYVVRVPSAGIPALTEEPGTGTGALMNDEPGSATCDIFRLLDIGMAGTGAPGNPALYRLPNVTKKVYNLTTTAITGDTWVLAVKDKYGRWFATTGGGGGASVPANEAVVRVSSGTASGTLDSSRSYFPAKLLTGVPAVQGTDVWALNNTPSITTILATDYVAVKMGTGGSPSRDVYRIDGVTCQIVVEGCTGGVITTKKVYVVKSEAGSSC